MKTIIFCRNVQCICMSAYITKFLFQEGNWVYITNCHLAPSCSKMLESIVVKLNTCADINPNFRLWLTTLPNKFIPNSVLGDSIKLAIEPSTLLRDQILEHFTNSLIADPEYYNSFPTKAANFTKLIYAIVFLISQCNGRHFYNRDGWSGHFYLFTTDLEICLTFLSIIMKNHDGINFEALHFLLNECNIINRIRDKQDRILFKITLNQVCNESLLKINRYKFSASSDFFVPNKILHEDFVTFIKELPIVQNFEAFNVSENSEILRQELEARNLIDTFSLSINRKSVSQKVNPIEKCKEIYNKLPDKLNIPDILSNKHSTFVIKEQLETNNYLLSDIKIKVGNLLSQLEGKQTLDPICEEFLQDIRESTVPTSWVSSLNLSTSNIHEYLERLTKYCSYYR